MVMVYHKALTTSIDASPPSGKVMTLLTSDVSTLCLNIPILFQYIMTPVQLIGTSGDLTLHNPKFQPRKLVVSRVWGFCRGLRFWSLRFRVDALGLGFRV